MLSCADKASPVNCTKGTYASENHMSCKDCPVGHGCPVDGLDAPILCTNGTYQNESKQVQCLACPAGYMCISIEMAPIACPDGLYSVVGVMGCTECPSGHR